MTTCSQATRLLRLTPYGDLTVLTVTPLTGGMVSRVEEWTTNGTPARVICKHSRTPHDDTLQQEDARLHWLREKSALPVPEPYGVISEANGTYLLMSRLSGRPLGEARLSPHARVAVQEQLADHLIALHTHQRATYGSVDGTVATARWLDIFEPRLQDNYQEAQAQLSTTAQHTIEHVLAHLDGWLPETHAPTLIHGDLWENNILVDDMDPDHPRIRGFIDDGAHYADVEYELAYLLVFATADDTFFRRYTAAHPLRAGFQRRCRLYGLNTLLLHLWMFGTAYLARCEQLVREINTDA